MSVGRACRCWVHQTPTPQGARNEHQLPLASTFVKKTTAASRSWPAPPPASAPWPSPTRRRAPHRRRTPRRARSASAPRTETGTHVRTQTATLGTHEPRPEAGPERGERGHRPTPHRPTRPPHRDCVQGHQPRRERRVLRSGRRRRGELSYFTSCENRVYVNADSMELLAPDNYSVYFRAYVYDFATARWVGSGWYLADGITSIYLPPAVPPRRCGCSTPSTPARAGSTTARTWNVGRRSTAVTPPGAADQQTKGGERGGPTRVRLLRVARYS